MKWILIPLFIVTFFLVQNFSAAAATKPKGTSTPSISVSSQYIKAKNIVRAFFGNIKGVTKVTYILTYEGNGVGQGVEGSFSPGKKRSFSRDIYLGTCSGKVCIQHKKIKNIQLQVTTKFTNGKSSSKIYKVK
jgi:hypothetical protein